MSEPKIPSTDEAWDDGPLGRDEAFVQKASDVDEAHIDGALELQPISVRLQKSLIEDLKSIATLNGLGYQPLMRQILKRWVEGEKKKILLDRVAEMKAKARAAREQSEMDVITPVPAKKKKVA